ncbi:MAG: hypothetical protein QM770_17585 [Tepidisphaeraceae bacterium]
MISLIAALIPLSRAIAGDHANLEEGLPTRVEDAYPVEYRAFEFQLLGRYENLRNGPEDRFTVLPRLEWGFAPNAQLRLAAPFYFGDADDTGSGNVQLEGFYNFNTESLTLPALALSLSAELPTGENAVGVDTTLKFIATKTIGDEYLDRLHLNLSWSHKFDRDDDERQDRYGVILGYSRRLDPDTILVADFIREQQLHEGFDSNIIEVGVRRQLDPQTVFSIGVGAGIGDDSPDFQLTMGLQRSF